MSRITIIPDDGAVIVSGRAVLGLDLSFIPERTHAVQWFGEGGWVERWGLDHQMLPNEEITSFEAFQPALTLWQAAVEAEDLEARRPFPSWVLNSAGDDWEAPYPKPNDTEEWVWVESARQWQTPEQVQAEQEAAAERQLLNATYQPAFTVAAMRLLTDQVLGPAIVSESLTEEQALSVALLVEQWSPYAVQYTAGRPLRHEGRLYEVMLTHTSQPDWIPGVANTVFRRLFETAPGQIPDWHPWDGHQASLHQIGSEVMHTDIHWVSTVANNHWEPGVFGWEPVEPGDPVVEPEPADPCDETVNVNTADFDTLRTLHGVDEVRAQAIIDGRPWASVYDLCEIDGINKRMIREWDVET